MHSNCHYVLAAHIWCKVAATTQVVTHLRLEHARAQRRGRRSGPNSAARLSSLRAALKVSCRRPSLDSVTASSTCRAVLIPNWWQVAEAMLQDDGDEGADRAQELVALLERLWL